MIELSHDHLIIRFPELEEILRARVRRWLDEKIASATAEQKARLLQSSGTLHGDFCRRNVNVSTKISFQRTLRIPDDGKEYPLPPGLGRFPLRHVDDFCEAPAAWKKTGGVMLPMHRLEAMWLNFDSTYPMALRIATGGRCAVSGLPWASGITNAPQNYVVLPEQPWLDGFRVSENVVRQFVAVPLGKGLTVEHQLTGEETWGGLQIQAFPMRTEEYWRTTMAGELDRHWQELVDPRCYSKGIECSRCSIVEEALGAGGRIRQEIAADPHGLKVWDIQVTSRCYVRLCLAGDWQQLTGLTPPQSPPTAQVYTNAGLPWFDYDDGKPAVSGATLLAKIKSVSYLVDQKTGLSLIDNESVTPSPVHLVVSKNKVQEF